MNYGEKIAALRKKNNMTQAQLGDALNVTYQAVSKWERDETHPDFETMSKIAKLFRIPLSYFEENGEESAVSEPAAEHAEEQAENQADAPEEAQESAQTQPEPPPPPKLLGVCKTCGKALYEGDLKYEGRLVCKACTERAQRAAIAQQKAEAQKKAQQEEYRKQRVKARKAERSHERNRGLIWSGIITGILLALSLISLAATNREDIPYVLGSTAVGAVFLFTFITQLFWGGVVRNVCLAGGFVARMPGVIFTLDLDGLIFLIVVKILFAIIKFLFFILTALACAIAALLISPFAFVPELVIRCRN